MFSGCLTLGDTRQVYPPTVGRELTDLRASVDRGIISPQEYEYKKAQILAGRRDSGRNRDGNSYGGGMPETFAPGVAQLPQEPQWMQQPGQPQDPYAQQLSMQPVPHPQEMQWQQTPQYAPPMQEMYQQQMQMQQQPQVQQLPSEGWH